MDAFAVSLGIGTSGRLPERRSKLRLAAHFGIFQTLMTLAGWLAGSTIAQFIDRFDHWIAFALLAYVSFNMFRSGLSKENAAYDYNPSKGRWLVILSVATSLDALAVGLSLGLLKSPVLLSSLLIGGVAFALSALALLVGHKLGEKFGKRMEIVGALILLFIGIRILVTHL